MSFLADPAKLTQELWGADLSNELPSLLCLSHLHWEHTFWAHSSVCPAALWEVNRLQQKPMRWSFPPCFRACLSSLCLIPRAEMRGYGWSSCTSVDRNVLSMQRAKWLWRWMRSWWRYTKTLLFSLSFFLIFSSAQENPSDWELAFIVTKCYLTSTSIWFSFT